MAPENLDIRQEAARLAERLEAVRKSSEDGLRDAFRRTVLEAVDPWPADRTEQVLALVREKVWERPDRERPAPERTAPPPADAASVGLAEVEQELVFLRAQLDQIGLDRDRLRKENEQLRGGQASIPTPAPTPPPMAQPTPEPAGTDPAADKLERIRQALIQLTQNKKVDTDSLELSEQQDRLFRLMRELLRFALDYELGVSLLLAEFKVGDTAEMDTQMMQGFRQLVRDRFRACLTEGKGAVKGLKEILDRNARFVVDLNSAYSACLSSGTQMMFEEIDPTEILAEHKRLIGHNYEEAWKSIVRRLGDLSDQSREDMWERYFMESFRGKLSRYLEQE